METTTRMETDLPSRLRQFRETTNLSLEKLARRADLSVTTVSNVARADAGRRFDPETEQRLTEAMDTYLHELVLDVSAQIGHDDPEIDKLVSRLSQKRKKR